MKSFATYFLFIISFAHAGAFTASPPKPLAPGMYFRTLVTMMNEEEFLRYVEPFAKSASPTEASLIRLFGEVASQCMQLNSPIECDLKSTENAKQWPDLIPHLKHHLSRGEYYALGTLFQCSVLKIEGLTEGQFLDCLKQAELGQLRTVITFNRSAQKTDK